MTKFVLLIVGALIGGAIGWYTAPPPVLAVNAGPVAVTVQGSGQGGTVTATGNSGDGVTVTVGGPGFMADRNQRTGVLAVIGALFGVGIGFLAERRGRS